MKNSKVQSRKLSSVVTQASCYSVIAVLMIYCVITAANSYGAHLPLLFIQSTNITGEMLISSYAAVFIGVPLGLIGGFCYWLILKTGSFGNGLELA
jgi:TRAP-type C4-dicarboxylate transport system permease small subunit